MATTRREREEGGKEAAAAAAAARVRSGVGEGGGGGAGGGEDRVGGGSERARGHWWAGDIVAAPRRFPGLVASSGIAAVAPPPRDRRGPSAGAVTATPRAREATKRSVPPRGTRTTRRGHRAGLIDLGLDLSLSPPRPELLLAGALTAHESLTVLLFF
ncbi:hypothetical protein SETIT_6G050000v2 [Setaria italica]|uniref:Uncharacterized protein n=1 Tax=Setaria italica TaxID=4555 RepID=A0A368RI58_SETIT|nr:hypothetical protein SETIT_6G050000v2 [Setaria italica]